MVRSASHALSVRSQGSMSEQKSMSRMQSLRAVFSNREDKGEEESKVALDEMFNEDAMPVTMTRSKTVVNLDSEGLSSALAEELLKKFGRNELPETKKPNWLIFLEQLYQPMPLMIWAAIIIEAAIESWPDMGILLGIQFMNASLSYYETTKAGDAVAALKASLKPLAYVKRDGKFMQMDAALLVPGDLVLLGAGGAVPADCVVKDSQIDVDQVS